MFKVVTSQTNESNKKHCSYVLLKAWTKEINLNQKFYFSHLTFFTHCNCRFCYFTVCFVAMNFFQVSNCHNIYWLHVWQFLLIWMYRKWFHFLTLQRLIWSIFGFKIVMHYVIFMTLVSNILRALKTQIIILV